jgi:hypothetical protein
MNSTTLRPLQEYGGTAGPISAIKDYWMKKFLAKRWANLHFEDEKLLFILVYFSSQRLRQQ